MSKQGQVDIWGGVDTHRDTHVAAVVDGAGWVLGSAEFRADSLGYEQLHRYLGSWGRVARLGVEGTGSSGTRLTRHLMGVEMRW